MTVPFFTMRNVFVLSRGISRFSTPSSAASPYTPSSTAYGLFLTDENNLKGDLLECQLVTRTTEEFHGTARRFIYRPQLNPNRLLREVRKGLFHLPIENKGDIGVELFLKLEELQLSMIPGSGFKHCQHKDILAGVMGKGIEHTRALDTGVGGRAVLAGQIFADGNHI